MNEAAADTVARLFNAHSRALLLYGRQWVGAAGAEDVVQRVFVRLLAGGESLPAEPRTWLFRCVRNEAISAWRSEQRRGRREQAIATEAASWFVPRPEDRIDARAAQAVLQALPPAQREVVTLRIWSELTLAEISSVTGLAISTVHDQYRSALRAMRERLESSCRTKNR